MRRKHAYARLTLAALSLCLEVMDTPAQLSEPPSLASLKGDTRVALFLDFDGTLVELAETPDGIDVTADLAEQLTDLAMRLKGRFALVSGRSVEDLQTHLGELPFAVAGSHGADIRSADGTRLGNAAAGVGEDMLGAMREFAAREGLDLEKKSHGLALHFRKDPSKQDAAQAFAIKLASANNLAVKHGKCVVELVEKGADKGRAVDTFMAAAPFAGSTPLFIGDDVTDEDGFTAILQHGGAGVLVGEREGTAATYALRNVSEVRKWLEIE